MGSPSNRGSFTSNTSLTQTAIYDFERGLYRVEVQRGGVVGQIYRISLTEARVWSTLGTKNLEAAAATTVRFGLIEGVLALRPSASSWTTLSSVGTVQIAAQSGTGVTLSANGQTTTLALAPNGLLLAQRFSAGGQDVQIAFSDYRVIGGLKFPHLQRLYEKGLVTSSLAYTSVIVNPVPSDADFSLPQ
jgi:hypothetical protein